MSLVALTLSQFCADLAAKTPTPGGGSQAAHLVANGASLVAMACRFSTGEKYAAVEVYMDGRAVELDALAAKALENVDADSRSYDAVSAAYKLAKATPEEKAARTAAIQKALQGALELPLETMQLAVGGLRLAAVAAPQANKNLGSDLVSGALCLWAGLEAAWCNVAINAGGISDKAWLEPRMQAAAALRREGEKLRDELRAWFAAAVAV
jgi:formiminotetrahydrofolate cyclodeaminase